MLIPFSKLIQKYNFLPKGIIHFGASHGEEHEAYNSFGVDKQVWVEAIPDVFEKLYENLLPAISDGNVSVFCACLSDKTGEKVNFKVTSNAGQSSSFLDLHEHKIHHPDVVVVNEIPLTTLSADDLIANNNINMDNYNFLNLDLQGAELLALKGMENNLKYIDYVYCEVNISELYKGNPLVGEIDKFLLEHGFVGKEELITGAGWGDKFYMRNN